MGSGSEPVHTAPLKIDWSCSMNTKSRRLRRMAQTVVVVLALLLLWQLADQLGILPGVMPSALDVAIGVVTVLGTGVFWNAIGNTLLSALIGWAIASALGIAVGLAVGGSRFLQRSTAFVMDFGRSFPALVLIPVFILLLGTNMTMKVVVVVLTCFWPVVIQTIQGSRRIDATVTDMARSYQIPFLLAFWRVRLPSALPFIATGVRLSASIAILVAVAVEVLSQTPGLGRQITSYQFVDQWDLAFAYLVFAGLSGWLIAGILVRGEARLLRWNRRSSDG